MAFVAIVGFCEDLDAMLHGFRTERDARPPVFSRSALRALWRGHEASRQRSRDHLSLGRFGIALAEQTRALERAWQHT